MWIDHNSLNQVIGKMKYSKVANPLGIAAEMLQPSGEVGLGLVTDLVNAIAYGYVVPSDCE